MIPRNPLTMVGTIDRCWLFTYRTPEANVEALLPFPLLPLTHNGYAFWNVVICHVDDMRPKGAPAFLGVSYWHVGYRLYARYPSADGTEIDGLYFLRSDCDCAAMAMAGNLMTDFRFHVAPVRMRQEHGDTKLEIASRDMPATARIGTAAGKLPAGSAFASLADAVAFLKYEPHGISVDNRGIGNIVDIVRDEAAWSARVVDVPSAEWAFLADKDVQPEICFQVDPIAYQWNRGRSVKPPLLRPTGEHADPT